MSRILNALRSRATTQPNHPAIVSEHVTLSYSQLCTAVEHAAARLKALSPSVLALLADNGIAWAVADLAALMLGIPIVPLPSFFSKTQLVHALRTGGVDCVLTDQPDQLKALGISNTDAAPWFYEKLFAFPLLVDEPAWCALPEDTQKITFTSGTTGDPKGVCLGIAELETTAESLRIASAATQRDRHLCVLPFATLLENIGGIYTPILAGATIYAPRLASVGLAGSSSLDVGLLLAALETSRATSAILIPQMLQAITAAGQAGAAMPQALRYLAVGGAPLSEAVLNAAIKLGLPVYEGYGLSECASVIAVNRPHANRRGSVGRPLPHVRVGFADDGEILVQGVRWRGYLGHAPYPDGAEKIVATGDLGYLDSDGFLHLTGRKKNIFITSFGRNVAPEWVERELVSRPPILQAAIFGEARPFNTAVIFVHPSANQASVDAALDAINAELPDYARVHAWVRAPEPFTPDNGLSTPNGRLRRDEIFAAYAARIDAHYSSPQRSANP